MCFKFSVARGSCIHESCVSSPQVRVRITTPRRSSSSECCENQNWCASTCAGHYCLSFQTFEYASQHMEIVHISIYVFQHGMALASPGVTQSHDLQRSQQARANSLRHTFVLAWPAVNRPRCDSAGPPRKKHDVLMKSDAT